MLYLRKIRLFLILFISIFCINSYANDFPCIWNISNTNAYFVGRKVILDILDQKFKNGYNIVTIVGSSGIGKIQISKRFAENYKNNYDIIWWVDSEKNIEEQFKKLAVEWNRITPPRKPTN